MTQNFARIAQESARTACHYWIASEELI